MRKRRKPRRTKPSRGKKRDYTRPYPCQGGADWTLPWQGGRGEMSTGEEKERGHSALRQQEEEQELHHQQQKEES